VTSVDASFFLAGCRSSSQPLVQTFRRIALLGVYCTVPSPDIFIFDSVSKRVF